MVVWGIDYKGAWRNFGVMQVLYILIVVEIMLHVGYIHLSKLKLYTSNVLNVNYASIKLIFTKAFSWPLYPASYPFASQFPFNHLQGPLWSSPYHTTSVISSLDTLLLAHSSPDTLVFLLFLEQVRDILAHLWALALPVMFFTSFSALHTDLLKSHLLNETYSNHKI